MLDALYKDNDNLVELKGVKNNATGTYVNNSANVTAKLEDEEGEELVEAQSLSYVAASDGDYQGTWDQALLDSVPAGTHALIYEMSEGGLDLKIKHWVAVKERMA